MKRLLLACTLLGGLALHAQATPVGFTFNGTTTSNQPVSASFGYDTDACSLSALSNDQYCTIAGGSASAAVNFLAHTYHYPNGPGGTNEYLLAPSGAWAFTIGDPAESSDSIEARLTSVS